MLAITGFYTALLGLMLLWLSFRVIAKRKALKIAHGTGGDDQLNRRRNAHSNFTEYVPITLILMATAEASNTSTIFLHAAGATLVVGRLIHAVGMTSDPENLKFRQIGMIMTFLPLLTLAVVNLLRAAQAIMAG